MATANFSTTLSVGGASYAASEDVTYDTRTTVSPTLAAPKTGELTTRTDANTGTLTMDTGHGITTGAKVDIYWTNTDGSYGLQYDVTVGTVSGDTVPFDLGAGDDLPLVNTDVRVQVQNVETVSVTGDNIKAIGLKTPTGPAHILLTESDDTPILRLASVLAGEVYVWAEAGGSTNPAAGVTVAKVKMTNGRVGASQIPEATIISV